MSDKTEIDRSVLERILDDAAYIKQEDRQAIREAIAAPVPPAGDVEVPAAGQWREGAPPHPWDSEWFLAEVTDGHYAVLRPLPEDFTYDFTTVDQTYLMRHKVKRWAQLSDSDYVQPEASPVPPAGDLPEWAQIQILKNGIAERDDDIDRLQSELTKARELIALQSNVIEFAMIIDKQAFAKGTQNVGVTAFRAMGDALSDLAHQSAPAENGVSDE